MKSELFQEKALSIPFVQDNADIPPNFGDYLRMLDGFKNEASPELKAQVIFELRKCVKERDTLPVSPFAIVIDHDGSFIPNSEFWLKFAQDLAARSLSGGRCNFVRFGKDLEGTSEMNICTKFAAQVEAACAEQGYEIHLDGRTFRDTRNLFFNFGLDNFEQMSVPIANLLLAIARSGMRIPIAMSSASARDRLEHGLEKILPDGLWREFFDEIMCVDDYEKLHGVDSFNDKYHQNQIVFERLKNKFPLIADAGQIIMIEDTLKAAMLAYKNGFNTWYIGDDLPDVFDGRFHQMRPENMADNLNKILVEVGDVLLFWNISRKDVHKFALS